MTPHDPETGPRRGSPAPGSLVSKAPPRVPLGQGLRRGSHLLFLFFGLLCFWAGSGAAVAGDETLRAGAARIDITPRIPVLLGGYASRKELSTAAHDPLGARVVAFERSGKHLVLVSLDLIGFYNGTAEPLRQAVVEACHLQDSELFLAAIHDHSSPVLSFDPAKEPPGNVEYTKILRDQLVTLVQQAMDRLTPVHLRAGSGSSPVGVNRRQVVMDKEGNPKIELGRNPSLLTDREVQVLRILRAGDGGLAAILFDHAVHSTSLGPRNNLVSGDVHGLAEQFIENYLGHGVVAPGFAGASGDIDPWIRVLPEFRTENGWIPEPVLLGTLLGEEVVRSGEGMSPAEMGGPIGSLRKILELPGKPPGQTTTTNNWPATSVSLTVGRVGQVAFVGFGGEMFNEIGQAIKQASPYPVTIIITHCNGAAGYLPTRPAYLEGGYEVSSSPFAPMAAGQVVKEALRMLHAL